MILQNYDFSIKYIKGASNASADALSRLHSSKSICAASSHSVSSCISEQRLKEAQILDEKFACCDNRHEEQLLSR